jgi:hypothetical protein
MDMKRNNDDIKDDRHYKMKRSNDNVMDSPYYSASPARSMSSFSPAYRSPQYNQTRVFKGCSKLSEYDFLNKLGEGTFG